jgi:protein SCO1/2
MRFGRRRALPVRVNTMIDQFAGFLCRQRILYRWLGVALGIACLPQAGCGRVGPYFPGAPAAAPPASLPPGSRSGHRVSKDYPLRGVVRSVAVESGSVVIRHEAIPGFMSAMTMPFQPADPAILPTLKPGDRVEGTLRVQMQDGAVMDYRLVDLKVTEPAQSTAAAAQSNPTPLVLDVSKGKVHLRQQPRRLEVGEPVPDFAMTGQDGQSIRLSDLRGKVVVLTFIYTRCPMPDFCPYMDRRFAELAQHLSSFPNRAKDIRLISVSFDPEHDTPAILRKHAQIRGAVPPLWSYAVASHEELAKVAAPLGLVFGPSGTEIAHNLSTAVIDRQGRLARLAVGTQANQWETSDLLKTIYALLTEGLK